MKRFLLSVIGALLPLTASATDVDELAPWLDSLPGEELARQLDTLPSPSATDEQGRTLLHYAVCQAPAQIPLLLREGVDPAITDDNDATALHRFFQCGHSTDNADLDTVVPALIAAGTPIQGRTRDSGRQPLHLALASLPPEPAPVDIYRDAARLLLARGAPVDKADDQGLYALHLAAGSNVPLLVDQILDAGADVNVRDNEGRTPLWLAAAGRHNLPVFEALLAAGANPALHPQDRATAAARSAKAEAWRKLDLLLQLQPEQALPAPEATATLATALWEGAPLPVAKRLPAAGAVVPELMQSGGGDLAWKLSGQARTEALDWLLAHDFPLNTLPPSGYPPLYFASVEATRLLLERGADPALASAQDGTVMAAFIEPPERFRQPLPHFNEEKVNLLLEAGYPVNLRDPQDMTALERAVRGNRLWLVEKLLAAGADPKLASGAHTSVVPLSLDSGRVPLIRRLIRAVNDFSERHHDLLLRYIREGGSDAAVAELLLLNGAGVHVADERGNTPLLWSARHEHWVLVSLLLDNGARRQHTNANGCDLDCYIWKMPDTLKTRLRGDDAERWQDRLPRLNDRPAVFFILALVPMTLLYLLVVAVRLHRHRRLWSPTLDLAVAGLVTLVVASMLFYRCEACLLPLPHQLPATALLALMVFSGVRVLRSS